jgi:hypothetical protein
LYSHSEPCLATFTWEAVSGVSSFASGSDGMHVSPEFGKGMYLSRSGSTFMDYIPLEQGRDRA